MILYEEIKLDYDDIIVKVEDRVRKELKENNYKEDMFGYVHLLENRKKEIIKKISTDLHVHKSEIYKLLIDFD